MRLLPGLGQNAKTGMVQWRVTRSRVALLGRLDVNGDARVKVTSQGGGLPDT